MEQNNKTPLYKRLLAIAGIVILLGLYVNLFIKAITGSPDTFRTFINCAAATVAVPIAIWVLIWATGVLGEPFRSQMLLGGDGFDGQTCASAIGRCFRHVAPADYSNG